MSDNPAESSPPTDLNQELEKVLQKFSAGGGLSEEVAAEYGKMQALVRQLQSENARLRAQLEADDALSRLVSQVEKLEAERRELLNKAEKAEAAQDQFDARFSEFEEQFSSLANLYVASNQLHGRLAPRAVVRRIKEILAQLVGAQAYVVYLIDEGQGSLVPVASEGVTAEKLVTIEWPGSHIGERLENEDFTVTKESPPNQINFERPPVVIPLKLEDKAVGAIAIYETLQQKDEFGHTDYELFRLLRQHAPSALVASALFERASGALPTAEDFSDLSI